MRRVEWAAWVTKTYVSVYVVLWIPVEYIVYLGGLVVHSPKSVAVNRCQAASGVVNVGREDLVVVGSVSEPFVLDLVPVGGGQVGSEA